MKVADIAQEILSNGRKLNFLNIEFIVLALGIAASWGYTQQKVSQHDIDLARVEAEVDLVEAKQDRDSDRLAEFGNRLTEFGVRQELIRRDIEKILYILEEDSP